MPRLKPSFQHSARHAVALTLAVGLSLLIAAPAAASPGSPNLPGAENAVYPPPVGDETVSGGPVEGESQTGTPSDPGSVAGDPATPAASAGSGLPFTGLSAAVMLVVGLLTLTAGLVVRRFSDSR